MGVHPWGLFLLIQKAVDLLVYKTQGETQDQKDGRK